MKYVSVGQEEPSGWPDEVADADTEGKSEPSRRLPFALSFEFGDGQIRRGHVANSRRGYVFLTF
jgi:hypothetical protein